MEATHVAVLCATCFHGPMSARGTTRPLLLPLVNAIRSAVYPEGEGDEGARRAFADEAVESNTLAIRWLVLFVAPLHVLVIAACLGLGVTDPGRVAWLTWLVNINEALLAFTILGASVSWRGRPAFLTRVVGDVGGAVYILGGAAMSANAQRVNPNLNVFAIVAFFTAFRLRMRPQVYVPSLSLGIALVIGATARFQHEPATRATEYLTVLTISGLSLFAFFLARGMRFRELSARLQVQQLNAQLNEKIRERSKELSMALARLAEDNRALDTGAVLGGRVEIEVPIGRGGMGMVYRGRDLLTDRAVAVKVVQAGSAQELDRLHRFLREAQIVASVTHPAIVRSIHVDVSEDGLLFQVMELVEGETLASFLEQGSLSPPLVLRLGAVLAHALATAHEARVVHLDVKPGNVILTRATPGLKLLDFGISKLRGARAVGGSAGERIIGTPEFLSPEQVSNPSRVDDRADVYALGLVLYLAIAGRMPFDAASPPAWLLAHTLRPPLDLQVSVPGIDPQLAEVVMSCLQKDPGERPAASTVAAELAVLADRAEAPALEDLVGAAISALSPSAGPRSGAVLAAATTQSSATEGSARSRSSRFP